MLSKRKHTLSVKKGTENLKLNFKLINVQGVPVGALFLRYRGLNFSKKCNFYINIRNIPCPILGKFDNAGHYKLLSQVEDRDTVNIIAQKMCGTNMSLL